MTRPARLLSRPAPAPRCKAHGTRMVLSPVRVAVAGAGEGRKERRMNATQNDLTLFLSDPQAGYAGAAQRIAAELDRLQAALEKIDRITAEWDANKLGGVSIQRKRWQRCGEIARAALGPALSPQPGVIGDEKG
jgi:transposase